MGLSAARLPSSGAIDARLSAPRPLIARRPRVLSGSFVLEDVDPLELARQLTLIDWEKFRAIAPRECLEASSKQKVCMHARAYKRTNARDTSASQCTPLRDTLRDTMSHWPGACAAISDLCPRFLHSTSARRTSCT